ncbi:MAG TPA: phosphoglycerate mutase family protein [Steroidobacteraceae bacterium]|nr:phosphoglycerate mutase family protein [Steroidobacteraceae bacterium]
MQRRPFLAPIGLALLSALAAMLAVAAIAWLLLTAGSTTIVIVRHAEVAQNGTADPPLSADGQARAALLARMFGDPRLPDHIDAIYVSPALRNRSTAEPLAARLGITPTVAPQDDPRALARRILHQHRGGRILVVGHSDTVPAIIAALSGRRDIPPIRPDEYDAMYIIAVPLVGQADLLSLRY